jgi:2'-5' RNA ligase
MRDFWAAHRWPAGEHHVHWHILFDDQPAVRDFARAHAEVLGNYPQLSPVPVEWLHSTLLLVGPLSPAQADELANAARPAVSDIEPFELEVGPAQALPNGVIPAIYPEDRISDLVRALRQVTERTIGANRMPASPERFWPRLSLAYSGARWDHDDLSQDLLELRPLRARMTVRRVVLVDQQQAWRDKYTWNVIAEVFLGKNRG